MVASADMAEFSSIDDVTATNALRAGGTVEQAADYVPGGNTPTKSLSQNKGQRGTIEQG